MDLPVPSRVETIDAESQTDMRVVAVDWSGAKVGAEKTIWLAEAAGRVEAVGRLTRLENGRSREQLVAHLIEESERDPEVAVGLDFSFSLPRWFLHVLRVRTGPDLWRLVESQGESWLAQCSLPFWGRPSKRRPWVPQHLRVCEREVGARSTFQIGGAGAVGTGSLRGMPLLLPLREAGFAVWPFDPPRLPVVIEIYPRLFTGPVRKSNRSARVAYLDSRFPELGRDLARIAASSEDAFDAAVSALAMSAHACSLANLPPLADAEAQAEGMIWRPPGS
jgi:hypothetical protein